MKINHGFWIAGILTVGAASSTMAADSAQSTEKKIAALEAKWTAAESANKPELIGPLLAEQGLFTNADGKVMDRSAMLEEERSNHYVSSISEDMKVTVFEATAVASYALHITGTGKSGSFDQHLRATDTWVKMPNGTWQVVASHTSEIHKP